MQLQDNVKARIQDESESNTFVKPKKDEPLIRSQYGIYDYLKERYVKD